MELDALFARLQDAKLEVDFANIYIKEIQRDIEQGIAPAEAEAHRRRARERQRCAVEQYMDVLEKFLAANGSESRHQLADYL